MAKKVKKADEYVPVAAVSGETVVITYNGKESTKSKCRLISGKYYVIGDINIKDSGDVYNMPDGVWYRIATGKIAWDYTLSNYNFTEQLVQGYIPEAPFIGNYSPNPQNIFIRSDIGYVFNEATITKAKLKYNFSKGIYCKDVSEDESYPRALRERPVYPLLPNNVYGMAEYPSDIKQNVAKSFSEYAKSVPASRIDKYLFNYKYGLEIETDQGYFPQHLYFKHGCLPLKDGSIIGTEITTILYSEKFNLFTSLFDELSKYTRATQNNSLHVNLSGFKNSPEFRVALYVLYFRLQQEINAFVPHYKRDLAYFTSKQGGPKDHCKPLESLKLVKRYSEDPLLFKTEIELADKALFTFLNEGRWDTTFNIKTRKHVREGGHKWDMRTRYYALNFIPLYFGDEKASRIEYRVHSGTVNKVKGCVWILICAAITKFVENNIERILCKREKITLNEIIQEVYADDPFMAAYIIEYIQYRENTNVDLITHNRDIYGNEFTNDPKFAFSLNGRTLFDE